MYYLYWHFVKFNCQNVSLTPLSNHSCPNDIPAQQTENYLNSISTEIETKIDT